ncbi:hypothetical protein [Streptomyces sp. NPDC017448]|uniref:hypothetical protein n=1 Tax=Streptomyces sp. NPDC017448 TaxID=3364996 RepID=UPI0037AF4E51
MTALQQHLLDVHRAARLSRPAPPPPGRHDGPVLRALYRRVRPAGRTAPPDASDPSAPPGG